MIKNIIIILALIVACNKAFTQETRIKIGMIDSGVSKTQAESKYMCKDGVKSALYDSGIDTHGHGTNVFGLITSYINPKTHCIISYKFFNLNTFLYKTMSLYLASLHLAIQDNVSYLNLSMGGANEDALERNLIKTALKKGIVIIAAAGNGKQNLDKDCYFFPACYKKTLRNEIPHYINNLYIAAAIERKISKSNYGNIIDFYEEGTKVGIPKSSGSSQATANATGKLISGKLKKHGKIFLRGINGPN